ncbi:hypothetical protein H0H93_014073 [Arthromyces matolae]|nr:hypothetical protein H0H93_014073 [Arthromyces matolae]
MSLSLHHRKIVMPSKSSQTSLTNILEKLGIWCCLRPSYESSEEHPGDVADTTAFLELKRPLSVPNNTYLETQLPQLLPDTSMCNDSDSDETPLNTPYNSPPRECHLVTSSESKASHSRSFKTTHSQVPSYDDDEGNVFLVSKSSQDRQLTESRNEFQKVLTRCNAAEVEVKRLMDLLTAERKAHKAELIRLQSTTTTSETDDEDDVDLDLSEYYYRSASNVFAAKEKMGEDLTFVFSPPPP